MGVFFLHPLHATFRLLPHFSLYNSLGSSAFNCLSEVGGAAQLQVVRVTRLGRFQI